MLDIGWAELLVIGVVALLVVPPKDLPSLLRTVGKYVGQMRRMATDFRSQFDQAMRDSELAEIRESVKKQVAEIKAPVAAAEKSINDSVRAMDDAARSAATAAPVPVVATSTAATVMALPEPAPELPNVTPVAEPIATSEAAPAATALDATTAAQAASETITPFATSTGRASVAQRAADAWKRAAGDESGA